MAQQAIQTQNGRGEDPMTFTTPDLSDDFGDEVRVPEPLLT